MSYNSQAVEAPTGDLIRKMCTYTGDMPEPGEWRFTICGDGWAERVSR